MLTVSKGIVAGTTRIRAQPEGRQVAHDLGHARLLPVQPRKPDAIFAQTPRDEVGSHALAEVGRVLAGGRVRAVPLPRLTLRNEHDAVVRVGTVAEGLHDPPRDEFGHLRRGP